MKILLTAGPIPAKLDSVKYITNRFKGGLALKTAESLCGYGHKVTVVKWKHNTLTSNIINNFVNVDDVLDYRKKVLETKADIYIMAAAVANLMPSNPWAAKFPSHNYSVGDTFNIQFEIAPRIIDEVKKINPRAGLIGYKLFDGQHDELIEAAIETLNCSKANIIFANTPREAKSKKYAITQDYSIIPVTFEEHIKLIHQLSISKFYRTDLCQSNYDDNFNFADDERILIERYPKYRKNGRVFGCFAVRRDVGFITTSRGKIDKRIAIVHNVDHERKRIISNTKATLNAPLLDNIFKRHYGINFIIHGHKQIKDFRTFPYEFPGTEQEALLAEWSARFNIEHHGYVAGFSTINDCIDWLDKNES